MEYVKLNNGVEMPVLGLGTYEGTDMGVALRSVRDALEVGYRLIDTAQYYGNEQYIGQALKESGVAREEVFLTSKIWFNRFEECYEAVLESLRTLQVDYLDLILLHWPFGNTYKAYRDLERLLEEGKVRSIGNSPETLSRRAADLFVLAVFLVNLFSSTIYLPGIFLFTRAYEGKALIANICLPCVFGICVCYMRGNHDSRLFRNLFWISFAGVCFSASSVFLFVLSACGILPVILWAGVYYMTQHGMLYLSAVRG